MVIAYIGTKEPRGTRTLGPMWEVVHDLFNEEVTPGSLERQPCCKDEQGRPEKPRVTEDDVLDAMDRLKQLQKRVRSRRRGARPR